MLNEEKNKFKNKEDFITPKKKERKLNISSINKFYSKKYKSPKKYQYLYTYDKTLKEKIDDNCLKYLKLLNNNIAMNKIIIGINNILSEIIRKNKVLPIYPYVLKKQKNDIFSLKKEPNITLISFLKRIIKYSGIECSTLFLSLLYLNKILESNLFLTDFNVHKLLSISILIAIKYNEDKISNNRYYGDIFGLTLKEINSLEFSYLKLLDFKLFVEYNYIKKFFNFVYKKIFNNL